MTEMITTNFNPFPDLSTERFKLRQLGLEDDKEIFTLRSDETVIKYLGRPPVKSIDEAQAFINKVLNGIANDEWIHWVIIENGKNNLIGTICLWNLEGEEAKAEIGFELLPEFMGKGIMQEVVPVIIDFGFKEMNLKYIEGEVESENIKSIKIMERFGFTFDRKLEKTVIYSLKNSN